MNISLSPQSEDVVREQLASGRYHSAGEVLDEALRVLVEQGQLAELRTALDVAAAQIERGEGILYTPALREEMRQSARQMAQEGRKPKADVCP